MTLVTGAVTTVQGVATDESIGTLARAIYDRVIARDTSRTGIVQAHDHAADRSNQIAEGVAGYINSVGLGSTGGGWQTVLDVDFTAEASQTLSGDGNYTVGGKTWTKINSASEAAAMTVGSAGLEISPAGNSTFFGYANFRQGPALVLPVSSMSDSIVPGCSLRVWVYHVYDNAAADFDLSVVGIANIGAAPSSTSTVYGYHMHKGYNAGLGGLVRALYHTRGSAHVGAVGRTTAYSPNAAVLLIPTLGLLNNSGVATCTFSAGWPSVASLDYHTRMLSSDTESSYIDLVNMSQWGLQIGACRYASGTAYKPRIGRVRVDVR